MKIFKSMLAVGLLVGFTTVARAETCGQMMASKAVLPATMATVMTAVVNMLDAHIAFMAGDKTPAAKKEIAALKNLAKEHKALAAAFTKTAGSMKKMADVPGAEHDMAKFATDLKIGASMAEMLSTHKAMAALIQKEIAEMEAMGAPKKK